MGNIEDEGIQNNTERDIVVDPLIKKEWSPFLVIKDLLKTRRQREVALDPVRARVAQYDISNGGRIDEIDPAIAREVVEAVEDAESLDKIEGVDFGKCDLLAVLKLYLEGKVVEVETVGSYMDDHDFKNGRYIGSTNDELVGYELGGCIKRELPNVKIVSLIDDFHLRLNDYYSQRGWQGEALVVTDDARSKFFKETEQRFRDVGMVLDGEIEGKDFYLVSESSKCKSAEEMVKTLANHGNIDTDEGGTWFVNRDAEDPRFRKILLKSAKGRWQCAALDAAGFMGSENQKSCHLVILPKSFSDQQDQVWEILKVLGFDPQNYHNIYFEDDLDPGHVTKVISDHIMASREKIIEEGASEFEVLEYLERNYGKKILEEDKLIIFEVAKFLLQLGIEPGSLTKVADIGTGPNFYPAMLASFLVHDKGSVELIEYSPSNRRYLNELITGEMREFGGLMTVWDKFEKYLVDDCGPQWVNAITRAKKLSKIIPGSIFDLKKDEYELVTSFFCSESITSEREEFERSIYELIGSVKPGGAFAVAHMVGSTGYFAGEGTHFPAISLSIEDLNEIYSKYNVEFRAIKVSTAPKARDEVDGMKYEGMAVVVGVKNI